MIKQGFCIRCGKSIPIDNNNPYCSLCGGHCSTSNRYSSSENTEMFCHLCGEATYVSSTLPICSECENKIKSEKNGNKEKKF